MAKKSEEKPPCPICKRPMEPFNGYWTCGHGGPCNEVYRPDSKKPGRWRVYRGLIWSPVGGPGRLHRSKKDREKRAA